MVTWTFFRSVTITPARAKGTPRMSPISQLNPRPPIRKPSPKPTAPAMQPKISLRVMRGLLPRGVYRGGSLSGEFADGEDDQDQNDHAQARIEHVLRSL